MKKSGGIKKIILMIAGILCVILAIIGIVIPVLPTTPFLLLAAFLFYRSSEKLHERLLNSKVLGEYIHNYTEYRAIKRKAKILTIILLWITLGISIIAVNNIYIRMFLLLVGISVSIHILVIKTLENIKNN